MSTVSGTVARATIILISFNIASKLTAVVREALVAKYFGIGLAAEAFMAAFTFPSVLFYLFTGALATVVVPIYSEYAAAGREREAWRLFGTFFNILLALLVIVTLLGILLAPWLVKLFLPGFEEYKYPLIISLTMFMFPYLIFSGLSSLFSGLLNARNVFAITALNGPLSNLAVICAILLLSNAWGVYGMALGVLAGGAAGALVQLPALRRAGFSFLPGVPLNHPDLKRIFVLVLPITISYSISETYILIDRFLATYLGDGAIPALNYANKIIQMPLGLFAIAIGTAMFPALTRRATEKDWRGMGESVIRSLRLVFLVSIPSAVIILLLREPLIALFYKRGVFDEEALIMTALPLFFYTFGLVGQAGEFILVRGFFALQDTRMPMLLSGAAVLINLVFSLILMRHLQHGGLALANSIAALSSMGLLAFFLHRRLQGQLWVTSMWRFILFVLLAALAMGGAVQVISDQVNLAAVTGALNLSTISGSLVLCFWISLIGAAGLLAFLAVLAVLRVEEVGRLWTWGRETAKRLIAK